MSCALAIRWLLEASQKHLGQNMAFKLSSELVDAGKGSEGAIRKKEATHRMGQFLSVSSKQLGNVYRGDSI